MIYTVLVYIWNICKSMLITLLISTTLTSMWKDKKNIKPEQLIFILLLLISDF